MAQFTAFKQEIKRRFSHKIAEVSGQGEILIIDLSQPTKIDQLVILEEMAQGEQVLKYSVEGFIDGKRIPICEGTSVEPSALRDVGFATALAVQKSKAVPLSVSLAVYLTPSAIESE